MNFQESIELIIKLHAKGEKTWPESIDPVETARPMMEAFAAHVQLPFSISAKSTMVEGGDLTVVGTASLTSAHDAPIQAACLMYTNVASGDELTVTCTLFLYIAGARVRCGSHDFLWFYLDNLTSGAQWTLGGWGVDENHEYGDFDTFGEP